MFASKATIAWATEHPSAHVALRTVALGAGEMVIGRTAVAGAGTIRLGMADLRVGTELRPRYLLRAHPRLIRANDSSWC